MKRLNLPLVERREHDRNLHRARNQRYRDSNKGRIEAKRVAKYDPKKAEDKKFRQRYGITTQDVERILAEQNFVCKICLAPITMRSKHVDHCHLTKKVRGLLCALCNKGLGLFHENPLRLELAAEYLRS